MKKKIKSKIILKLNKHTISNLNLNEMNSLKGGTQLISVETLSRKCNKKTIPPSQLCDTITPHPGLFMTLNEN